MGNPIPYRWICPACRQANAAGVAKCVKCNAMAVAGSADVDDAAWRAAIGDDDPAGLREEWPLHIRWIDGAAITVAIATLFVLDLIGFATPWIGGLLVAGALAIAGEYAKHAEHRQRVRRYIATLEAAEERAIRRGEPPAAAPDLPGVADYKRPRLLGAPVLALLTGMVAWVLLFEAPLGILTAIGVVCAGLCALLCWSLWDRKAKWERRAGGKARRPAQTRRANPGKRDT